MVLIETTRFVGTDLASRDEMINEMERNGWTYIGGGINEVETNDSNCISKKGQDLNAVVKEVAMLVFQKEVQG